MKDLFDFFRENEEKLHERPPEQVWRQLEHRLERDRRPKQRKIQFLQTWAVVLLLLTLTLAAVAVWHYSRKI
jgi:predicted lysophospholipase L1 biosynthesis ABC-type transport system permease subunit